MSTILKYAAICLSLVLIVTVAVVFFVNREADGYGKNGEQKGEGGNQLSEQNDNYKTFFNYDGNKSQTIYLEKGKAEFNVVYSGNSKFTARVLNTEGTFLVTLAEVYGPYNQRQIIDVPQTGPYLLEVTALGEWSLSRK